MANDIMAEEMQTEKKVAFANRKYNNEDKRKKEEEELEQLITEQNGEAVESTQEAEPTSAEERSFKKRYGDLRRHMQDKEKSWEDKFKQLEGQLKEVTQQEIKLPKSDDDIEAWAKQYPDVAAIVETIAIKKAREQSAGLEDRVKEIDEMRATASREKAEAELMKAHPDFGEIRESDEFHEWADEQPKWVQDALYENDNDARSAARAIDLYKADRGISKEPKKKNNKGAAETVKTKTARSKPQDSEADSYLRESQVQKMNPAQYEKMADEIMEAIRIGKFVYAVSGSAR